ncbi:unnamed protein product [Ectocarpus fasciculatus]
MRFFICLFALFSRLHLSQGTGEATTLSAILEGGVSSRVYPGAVAMAGRGDRLLFAHSAGRLSYPGDREGLFAPMTLSSVFDVASLSKVLATTSAVAWLYQRGLLDLDSRVMEYLGPSFSSGGKADITLRHCLLHNSGLAPDPDPWYWDASFGCRNTPHEQPEEDFSCLGSMIYYSLMSESVLSTPGEEYVYSDLGFITLSFVVGKVALQEGLVGHEEFLPRCRDSRYGEQDAVRMQCAFEAFVRTHVFGRLSSASSQQTLRTAIDTAAGSPGGPRGGWMPHTQYLPPQQLWSSCAPTLNDTGDGSYTHKRLQGQVADGDCYAMGGIAGHAGVFSTAGDIGLFLAYMLTAPESDAESFINASTIEHFTSIYNVSQSSRALGWTTNSNEAKDYGYDHSCGSMHEDTFMHTGYTGTCMCADPVSGLWSVILTTRYLCLAFI